MCSQRFTVDSEFAHSDGEVLSLEVTRSTYGTFFQRVCLQVEFRVPNSQLLVQGKEWRLLINPMWMSRGRAWHMPPTLFTTKFSLNFYTNFQHFGMLRSTKNVALPPSGAARSQVDQGRRRGYHKNEITKLPQCNV